MVALRRQFLDFAQEVLDARLSVPSRLARRAELVVAQLKRTKVKKVIALHPRPPPEKMTSAEIREACVQRADGKCECGCGRAFTPFDPAEWDHWLGGNGRRRQKESVETTWMLIRSCHQQRTRNWPSAEHWNALREAFCKKWNYAFKPHIVHQPLQRRVR